MAFVIPVQILILMFIKDLMLMKHVTRLVVANILLLLLVLHGNAYAFENCRTTFPSVLNSTAEIIRLTGNVQIQGTTNGVLVTEHIEDGYFAGTRCDGVRCIPSNTLADRINIDYQSGDSSNGALETTWNNKHITISGDKNYSKVNFGWQSSLTIEGDALIKVAGKFELGGSSTLTINGDVTIYANGFNVNYGGSVIINGSLTIISNAAVHLLAEGGMSIDKAQDFAVFARDNLHINAASDVKGLFYSDAEANVYSTSQVTGAVTARKIIVNDQAQFYFDNAAVNAYCNHAPIADNQTLEVEAGEPLAITLTGSDIDSDNLSFQITSTLSTGTITGTEPNIIYTSAVDFEGEVNLAFIANDGELDSQPAVIKITVIQNNEPPTIVSTPITQVVEQANYAYDVDATDPNDDPLTYSVSIAPQGLEIATETGLINWLAPSSYAQPVPTFNNQCYIVPEDIERVGSGDSESAYVLPLFQRVRNAISQGSSFIAPQADAWHRRNGCLGCHVQTQTLLGLQASKAKADVDEEIAEYLLSEILASQQSDGSIRRSHPGHSKNQTAFALWALSYVPDQNRTFDARAKGLRYFFGVKQSNGTTTSWGTDHSSGWLRSSDAITGLLSLTASRYLSDAQSQSNLTESQLAVVFDYTEQLPLIVRYFLNNAYNDDANNLTKTFRLIGLAEARKHITDPALLGEVNTAISYIDNLLRSRQKVDGGWPVNALQSESDPLTAAWVGFALNYQNPPLTDPVVSNNIEYLLSVQNPNGTWVTNSGLFSTHLATTSLVMAYLPVALEFLGNPDVSVSNILLDDKQLQLSALINNRGLGDIVVPINVTFYNGHPDQNNPLGSVELSGLESNSSTVATLNLTILPDNDVFVVLNATPATPECEVTNNQSIAALVQVNATYPKGLSDNQTFLINVLDHNEAPTITSQPITLLAQGSAYDYTVTIADPDIGDAQRYLLPVTPAGLFIDSNTGKFSYDFEQLPVGNHNVTVRVIDLRGLSAEQSFVLTVEANHAPVITSQAPTEAQVGQPYQYNEIAEDGDGDTLLYTLRVSPLTMSIDPATGQCH